MQPKVAVVGNAFYNEFDIYFGVRPTKGSRTAVRFAIVLQPSSQQGSKTAVRFTIVSQPSPQQGSKTAVGFTVVLQPSPQQGSKTAVRFTIVSQPSPQHLSASLEMRSPFLKLLYGKNGGLGRSCQFLIKWIRQSFSHFIRKWQLFTNPNYYH